MTSVADKLWEPQPEAAAWITASLSALTRQSPFLSGLEEKLRTETGTRLIDWVDHMAFPSVELRGSVMGALGFCQRGRAWIHEDAIFPAVYEVPSGARVGIRAENIDAFLAAGHSKSQIPIDGSPGAALRRALVDNHDNVEVWAVERHGTRRWTPASDEIDVTDLLARHQSRFAHRDREFDTAEEGFAAARELIENAVREIGVPRACDLFFAAERDYWESRNSAARVQKARQDRLGMGWANHDHHTYRSSRAAFAPLIETLELLGFVCRERFYAGRDAGWGAQVLEQPQCGLVVFADVDLAADEVSGDFAHQPLPARATLGTVGLWCQLHGEAFLQAGMHHLECQFDFDQARQQLKEAGVDTMEPFTDFPHLRQAFTRGENWQIKSGRIDAALEQAFINEEQARQFRQHGAIGSHLEILERNDGYKGFNQTGISDIIRETDPRTADHGG